MQLITWPAIIKYAGAAELDFIKDQAAWDAEAQLHGFRYETADALIDSSGEIYSLPNVASASAQPEPSGKFAQLEDVIVMVRAHAAQQGSCCVAKFYATSLREAIAAIGTLN